MRISTVIVPLAIVVMVGIVFILRPSQAPDETRPIVTPTPIEVPAGCKSNLTDLQWVTKDEIPKYGHNDRTRSYLLIGMIGESRFMTDPIEGPVDQRTETETACNLGIQDTRGFRSVVLYTRHNPTGIALQVLYHQQTVYDVGPDDPRSETSLWDIATLVINGADLGLQEKIDELWTSMQKPHWVGNELHAVVQPEDMIPPPWDFWNIPTENHQSSFRSFNFRVGNLLVQVTGTQSPQSYWFARDVMLHLKQQVDLSRTNDLLTLTSFDSSFGISLGKGIHRVKDHLFAVCDIGADKPIDIAMDIAKQLHTR